MNETFEQFCDRMGKVEKTDEFIVGRAHEGNSRATFDFEGHHCCLESWGYRHIPDIHKRKSYITPAEMIWVASAEPHDEWVLCDWVRGKSDAWKLANQYGGKACPDEYHEDDQDAWYLRFFGEDGFEKLMKVIYDYKNGLLPKGTFPWREQREAEMTILHA